MDGCMGGWIEWLIDGQVCKKNAVQHSQIQEICQAMVLKVPLGEPVRSKFYMIPHGVCSYLNPEKVEGSLHDEHGVCFLQRGQYGKRKTSSLWRNLTTNSQPGCQDQHPTSAKVSILLRRHRESICPWCR